jgi:succinoglycan biosynthesis transport protein ExoP
MDASRPGFEQSYPVEKPSGLGGAYRDLIRRRWQYPALIVPITALLSVFVAYILPVSYQATGTIMLEPSSIPKDLIQSTVRDLEEIPAYAEQSLELVRRRVLTPDRMAQLVKELDPYPRLQNLTAQEKGRMVVENVSVERVDPITLKPLDTSTAFSIHYNNPNPVLAAKVVSRIVDLYLTYNQTTRAEQADAAYQFLRNQAQELETSMTAMEQKLAGFKAKNGSSLPEMQAHNMASLDRAQHDLENVQQQLLVAEEKEAQLQLQLNQLSPSATAAVSDWRTQLAKLRSDLATAEVKYTPEHPEIKRLKRAIADMLSQGATALKSGPGKPDNPDYLVVQSQLSGARNQIATLRAAEARNRKDIAQYEQNLSTTPNVERDYVQLQRDYDTTRNRYEDLQGKMKNAALARTLESESRGERFALLQAPKVPGKVYFPNRLGIMLLGLVLGCGLALGCVALLEATDPTVRGMADLQDIIRGTALGAVPTLLNPRDLRIRRLRWSSAFMALTAATVFVAATVLTHRH